MTIYLDRRIELTEGRCSKCGRFYAYEGWQVSSLPCACVICVTDYWRKAQETVAERERTISALRGALKRKARRAG